VQKTVAFDIDKIEKSVLQTVLELINSCYHNEHKTLTTRVPISQLCPIQSLCCEHWFESLEIMIAISGFSIGLGGEQLRVLAFQIHAFTGTL